MMAISGYSVSTQGLQDIYHMLMTKRPDGSLMEKKFVQDYVVPLGVTTDRYGNLIKIIGDVPTIWCSHTDTVHNSGGYQIIAQNDKHVIKLHSKSTSNCLGADDTAGVWLMREMILAERPGMYIFHRGEECGGKGSRALVKDQPNLVEGYRCIIALDRKEKTSIITRQFGGKCCSSEFVDALAKKLDMGYKADPSGTFTDSASYVDIIGECTNLSVGYNHQHSDREELDLVHLLELRERLLEIDTRDLVFKRVAGEKEVYRYSGGNHSYYGGHDYENNYSNWQSKLPRHERVHPLQHWDHPDYVPCYWNNGSYYANSKRVDCTFAEWKKARNKYLDRLDRDNKKARREKAAERSEQDKKSIIQVSGPNHVKSRLAYVTKGGVTKEVTLLDIIKDNPSEVSKVLDAWGFDAKDLLDEVYTVKMDQIDERGALIM